MVLPRLILQDGCIERLGNQHTFPARELVENRQCRSKGPWARPDCHLLWRFLSVARRRHWSRRFRAANRLDWDDSLFTTVSFSASLAQLNFLEHTRIGRVELFHVRIHFLYFKRLGARPRNS